MIHLCDSYPGKKGLQAYQNEVFEQNNYNVDDVIPYKQWIYTNRTTLVSLENSPQKFIVMCLAFDHL